MSRETFIAGMASALGHDIRLTRGQPSHGDLEAYFRTLQGDPQASLRAYREYASLYYVHAMHIPGHPTGDVVWPGQSCDRWAEITSRRQHERQRIIDCEGYAFMAAQLLVEAGWILRGFQIIYLLQSEFTPDNYHIVAVLVNPVDAQETVHIGSPNVSYNWLSEARRVFPDQFSNAHLGPLRLDVDESIRAAQAQMEEGPEREIAPLRGRRSHALGPR